MWVLIKRRNHTASFASVDYLSIYDIGTILVKKIRLFLAHGLIQGGMRVMAVNAIGMGLAYASHVLFAKWLGVEHYGYYVYALAWLSVLTIFVQLGLNTSTVRITAELRASNDNGAILGLSIFSTFVVVFVGTAVLILGGVLLAMATDLLSRALSLTLAVMLPLVVVLSLLNQRMALLQGFERVAYAQFFLEIIRPVLLIAAMGISMQFIAFGAPGAMTINLIVTAVTLVVATWAVIRNMNAVIGGTTMRQFRSREWLRVSLPYLVIGGLTIAMQQSAVLMLGTMLGGVPAGLYVSAAKLSQLILFPMMAIRSRAAPMLARLFAENDHMELQRQMNVTTVTSVLTGVMLAVGLVWQREPLLALFGTDFVVAAPAILVLAVGMAVFSITGGVEVFLIFGPFERVTTLIYVLVLAVNIVLNLILIPRMGFMGAAYATTASVALRGAISAYVVWRRAGILPWATVAPIGEKVL